MFKLSLKLCHGNAADAGIFADLPDLSCSLVFSGGSIQESQLVGPDPSLPRAREELGGVQVLTLGGVGKPKNPRTVAQGT